jgi:hypothetical protein
MQRVQHKKTHLSLFDMSLNNKFSTLSFRAISRFALACVQETRPGVTRSFTEKNDHRVREGTPDSGDMEVDLSIYIRCGLSPLWSFSSVEVRENGILKASVFFHYTRRRDANSSCTRWSDLNLHMGLRCENCPLPRR